MKKVRNLEFKTAPDWIAPSILSADFSKLGSEIKEVEAAGADWIHVDVMDGHFVPNVTIGPVVVKGIRPVTELPLDCHLMVSEPEKWLGPFAKAGADVVTIHAEVCEDLSAMCKKIKSLKCLAGVSINPDTPVEKIEKALDDVDLVLVMSVFPGFGGQKFISDVLDKCRKLRDIRGDREYLIEIDGGISAANVKEVKDAGVDVFVAGSAIFNQESRKKAIDEMRENLQ